MVVIQPHFRTKPLPPVEDVPAPVRRKRGRVPSPFKARGYIEATSSMIWEEIELLRFVRENGPCPVFTAIRHVNRDKEVRRRLMDLAHRLRVEGKLRFFREQNRQLVETVL